MNNILRGMDGVLCHMDDVLISGTTQEEHDTRLHKVLQKLQFQGVTLNRQKCEFGRRRLTFLDHTIDGNCIPPDPHKTNAILKMVKPKTPTELWRFLGMVNQLSKFTPNIASLTKPLREPLSTKKSWCWSHFQDEAFEKVKMELTKPSILAFYSPDANSKISSDASSFGLRVMLLQQHADKWRPVAYASRAMSDTEQRYSQIEKEALSLVWACEKFSDYVIGRPIHLETDHKPLVPLLSKTYLDCLPPQIVRFRLRLMQFNYTISHIPGKLLYTADTLSCAPVDSTEKTALVDTETEMFVQAVISQLPVSTSRLDDFRKAQNDDSTCCRLTKFCKEGWPSRHDLSGELCCYFTVKDHLSIADNLLLYGNRIIIPHSMRDEILRKVHAGHQGIKRCRLRLATPVWWPGVSKEIEQFIKLCPVCMKNTTSHTEPLLQPALPSHPWEKIAADFFSSKGNLIS